MNKLTRVFLDGYKSFRHIDRSWMDDVQNESGNAMDLGDVTVLVGPNGAGKSNALSAFKMLHSMAIGAFQEFVRQSGNADSLLNYGLKRTSHIKVCVQFQIDGRDGWYEAILGWTPPDKFVFTSERVHYDCQGIPPEFQETVLTPGGEESKLPEWESGQRPHLRTIREWFLDLRPYQFHDTSPTARIRRNAQVIEDKRLMSDGGNLAAFLYAMRENPKERPYYNRIVDVVTQVYPQFKDFGFWFDTSQQYVRLNWWEKRELETPFDAHLLSDGTLRFMALATLFLQPPDRLPSVIVVDEPELGLHPHAISILAGLVHGVSNKCQVILATQSTRLLDEFGLDQIVVLERDPEDLCTRCKRLSPAALEDWVAEYSTSQLWEKNVLGGTP